MFQFTYPAKLTPDKDGGFVVTFRDFPEAITQGDSSTECLHEAADCLDEALAGRIDDGESIPVPSKKKRGEYLVSAPLQTVMKAAVYLAMEESGISKVELARKIGKDEKEVRRILDPHYGTKLPAMEQVLNTLGKHAELVIS